MSFNTAGFLFFFLPVSVVLYTIIRGKNARNWLLAVLSAVFYLFGGAAQLPVLVLSAVWDYFLGWALGKKPRRWLLAIAVGGNLALLGVYKYLVFVLSVFGLPALSVPLGLPLGISFFTFHGISYLTDIYRRDARPTKRFERLFLYLAFFPRLLAGPIVSWKDAAPSFARRRVSWTGTAAGLRRFVAGMAKKLLLSEGAAAVANAVYALPAESMGAGLAWVGAIAYCLQIYFDFSGYSDMALGLGRVYGFRFPENFNYPYASVTLSDFWRRWHMSLNRWFVNYLYIPLGGSRRGTWTTVRNKLIVFFFTGLWHGAGWTFILWGLWHGVLVSAEGLCKGHMEALKKRLGGRVLLRIYTLLAVIVGFVLFRAESVGQGLLLLGRMFSFASAGAPGRVAAESVLTPARLCALIAGAVLSLPVVPALRRWLHPGPAAREWLESALALAGLLLCVLSISAGGFSPFIYQQF